MGPCWQPHHTPCLCPQPSLPACFHCAGLSALVHSPQGCSLPALGLSLALLGQALGMAPLMCNRREHDKIERPRYQGCPVAGGEGAGSLGSSQEE